MRTVKVRIQQAHLTSRMPLSKIVYRIHPVVYLRSEKLHLVFKRVPVKYTVKFKSLITEELWS
jgi:hypothetical protein